MTMLSFLLPLILSRLAVLEFPALTTPLLGHGHAFLDLLSWQRLYSVKSDDTDKEGSITSFANVPLTGSL